MLTCFRLVPFTCILHSGRHDTLEANDALYISLVVLLTSSDNASPLRNNYCTHDPHFHTDIKILTSFVHIHKHNFTNTQLQAFG